MANESLTFPHLEQVLGEMAESMRENYKDRLTMSSRIASGELQDSISARVEHNGTKYDVVFDLLDYWKWVENDTKPHWMPSGALLRWIRLKPIIPREDANGRIPSAKSLDYLIRRKIAREGTKGSHDLRESTEQTINVYAERLKEAFAEDVGYSIESLLVETSNVASIGVQVI